MKANRPTLVRLERIENGLASGTPDIHGIAGLEVWIELKVVSVPKRDTSRFFKKGALRKAQIGWHALHIRHGGRSCVLARDGRRELYLIPACDIPMALDMSFAQAKERFHVPGGWPEVFSVLFKLPSRYAMPARKTEAN